ncbi:hypothetical protein Pmani_012900 [Petrolisthes manimaculis]|uniref:Uncharacterized protein n=1 Tax=Petrolisthes manimaculis TaxID=1843537 RepID=A0AAE1UA39_9EUCA|nr:hypothetical protein Pmani_012900 [Petrolisthes manimaculis]
MIIRRILPYSGGLRFRGNKQKQEEELDPLEKRRLLTRFSSKGLLRHYVVRICERGGMRDECIMVCVCWYE